MTPNIKMRLVLSATITAFTCIGINSDARPNLNSNTHRSVYDHGLRTTANACKEATAAVDLDINNVRARLMTGGDMWWNIGIGEASYEVPKGTKKSSLFAGSVWLGGYDPQGQLKVAAQTYRQDGNDYWPGPLDLVANAITSDVCLNWDRFWKVNKADIIAFRDLISKGDVSTALSDPRFEDIKNWPARGNGRSTGVNGPLNLDQEYAGRDYAPFVDVNNDGKYDVEDGDFPGEASDKLPGDQLVWWVFNDKGNVKQQTKTDAIGIEVQASAFAFSTKDALNDATFYRYRLINRSNLSLDSAYIATWTDADLGYAFDDYIGCDTVRGLGILYNGTSVDGTGQINSYGTQIPMVGIDFFEGPIKYVTVGSKEDTIKLGMSGFYYYNNNGSNIGNPTNGQQIYGYMTGSIRNGQRFSFDWDGAAGHNSTGYGSGPVTNTVFFGDPGNATEWSECICNNLADDRRFIHSAGPFRLEAGGATNGRSQNDVTIGVVWAPNAGGCPNTSFKKIRAVDDLAQDLFDSGFKTIEGPEAPRMVIREMDRKLVFYLQNDPIGNNYMEKFGTSDSLKYHAVSVKNKKHTDSLYKFEGYRVFQLKNSEIQAASIFKEDGTVNNDVAIEVFQCDVKNNVNKIINWNKTDLENGNDSTWIPSVKVNGKDSGVSHSFSLVFDAFAKGSDKRLVNYRNYYYAAIAYAYNDFGAKLDPAGKLIASFNQANKATADSTQDSPYIESAHGQGGISIPAVAGMPNPSNGNMGTVLNSDYGTGVTIKRIEGMGNGGNSLQMTPESEAEALEKNQVANPIYQPGQSPVNVKVIDPQKVVAGNWELYLTGALYPNGSAPVDSTRGIMPATGSWKLVKDGTVTIYSERDLGVLNEQILEEYGLSVSIKQVLRPGDDQSGQNGYISTDITYADPGKTWLAGVHDEENRSYANWIRSGGFKDITPPGGTPPLCDWKDNDLDTVSQVYESFFSNNTLLKGSWTNYAFGAMESRSNCGFGVINPGTGGDVLTLSSARSVDIVMTSDKMKWTKCVVLEMQDESVLAEGGATKFRPRKHASWTSKEVDADGNPIYDGGETGRSWFPGYAVDQETGERLNIAFGEDSWLKDHNGGDMIWNPTSTAFTEQGGVIYGGKHAIYILNTKYDEGASLYALLNGSAIGIAKGLKSTMMWMGLPLINNNYHLLPLKDGLIPTETRLRFRVTRPYAKYAPDPAATLRNNSLPLYSFSTDNLAKSPLTDGSNIYAGDKQKLLDQIHAVPNPYYGYTGYEINRLDTRVRIINLPAKATISIYSLDGTLIRRLTKDNPNVSYVDWNILNTKGLPIASGMYLIHINADGIGETVVKWFGAMRPIDVTNY